MSSSRMSRMSSGLAWLPLVLLAVARPAVAQYVHGTVSDSVARQRVEGVVLMLLDSGGTALGRTISNERGEYRLVIRRGAKAMRVLRIGFRARVIPLSVDSSSDTQVDVRLSRLPTLLEPIRVAANPMCPRESDADATFALLEQARAGLLAVVVAREASPAALERLLFERTMNGTGDAIERQVVRIDSAPATPTSFSAVYGATDFLTRGFAEDSGATAEAHFFAPDADVLLDEGFARGYCFHIAHNPRDHPDQLGLAFAPADRRPRRVDIEGALWIDTLARGLRDIEFVYRGLGHSIEAYHPGGRVEFRAMPNGVVLIDRWSMRLIGTHTDTTFLIGHQVPRAWPYASESGGEVARAAWSDGQRWRAPLGTLRLHATRRGGAPAAGTAIHFPGTDYKGTADTAGNIEIDDILPGPYSVAIDDPRLAGLGLDFVTPLKFVAARDSTVRLTLETPTLEDFVVDRCLADGRQTVRGLRLLGRVIRPDGQPVRDVKISLARVVGPGMAAEPVPYSYQTGSDGLFQFCGAEFQIGTRLLIYAKVGRDPPFETMRVLTDSLTIVRVPVPMRP